MARSRLEGQLLQESAAFHKSLEMIFKEGKEMLFSELTDDGSMFCLLELLASQQVLTSSPLATLLEGINRTDYSSTCFREI